MRQSLLRSSGAPAGRFALVAVFGCLLAGSASAAVMSLPPGSLLNGFPDITVGNVSVNYDAATNTLHAGIASGGILTIDQDGVLPSPDHTLYNSFFDVFVTIDHAGVASGGTLSIGGNYDSLGGPLDSLNSSTLTGFGYDSSTGIFRFLFGNTTGNLPGFGSQIGIILAANFQTGPPAGFASSFSNGVPGGNADAFVPAPEPSSMIAWSMLSAAAGLAGWRRARRRG
jgi:hypothetical protein